MTSAASASKPSHVGQWFKGPLVAVLAMLVYGVALGVFMALTLLVMAMEEGDDGVSSLAVPVTEALVLLSQGAGFDLGSVRLTLMPLLLTVLLIGVIRAFTVRFDGGWRGYLTGLAVWIGINLLFMPAEFTFVDPMWLVAVKCGVVFTIGHALAEWSTSPLVPKVRELYRRHVGRNIRRALNVGLTLGAVIIALYLACGVVTFGVWAAMNWRAMGEVFEMSGMQTGSRILTTILTLGWLPNLCIWAVSWLFGGGFSIGELADFTLWVGQSTDLPPVPVFGLFPEPVGNDIVRIVLLTAPIAVGLVAGMIALLISRGFHVRVGSADDPSDWRRLVELFAYPAAGFCLTGVTISLAMSALFALSNGSLGHERLAHVGVDVMDSTQAVARPTALGLLAAWLLVLIAVSAVFGVRWIRRRHRDESTAPATAAATAARNGGDTADRAPEHTHDDATDRATGGASEDDVSDNAGLIPRVVNSQPTIKEE